MRENFGMSASFFTCCVFVSLCSVDGIFFGWLAKSHACKLRQTSAASLWGGLISDVSWLTWNTTPKISTPKLLPPVDAPWKGLWLKKIKLCFSFFNLLLYFLFFNTLLYLCSLPLSSFLLIRFDAFFLSLPVAAAVSASGPSMGAALAAQQSPGTCT